MDELLVELLAEVELQEEHSKPKLQQRDYGGKEEQGTAAALTTKAEAIVVPFVWKGIRMRTVKK